MTDWLVFKTAQGHSVAIPDEDITGVWSAEKPGHMIIERVTDEHPIEVVFEFDEFVNDYFDHIDTRPKQKRRGRPRTKPKKTDNVISLESRDGS